MTSDFYESTSIRKNKPHQAILISFSKKIRLSDQRNEKDKGSLI